MATVSSCDLATRVLLPREDRFVASSPAPSRTRRSRFPAVFLLASFFFALLLSARSPRASEPEDVAGPRGGRRLAFAITRAVSWNADASEGEVVVTKGLKGFSTSYAVRLGDARAAREDDDDVDAPEVAEGEDLLGEEAEESVTESLTDDGDDRADRTSATDLRGGDVGGALG